MGCNFSCKRLSPPSKSSNSKNIRIVHMNGYIEEIDYPVTVAEVTGKSPKHFLFTQAQLLVGGSMPLKLDTLLEPSRVYFLLPYTLFDSNVSPVDLVPIIKNLASMAANNRSKSKSRKKHIVSSTATGKRPNRHFSDRGGATTGNGQVLLGGIQKSIQNYK